MDYLNSQRYYECAMVAAINSAIFLRGKEYVNLIRKEYEKLVDFAGARHGAGSLNIHSHLGIRQFHINRYNRQCPKNYLRGNEIIENARQMVRYPFQPIWELITSSRPVEFDINDREYGRHRVTCIGIQNKRVQVLNASDKREWIPWGEFGKWVVPDLAKVFKDRKRRIGIFYCEVA